MKTCISTYSYHRLYKNGVFTDFDAIDQTKEFGADGVELLISEDLVPAEKSLFDYYSRFGYKTAFYAKKQSKNLPVPQAENRFVWCKEHIEYILAEHAKYGTDILKNDGEIYSVFGSEYIKVPCERNEEYRYGMLLELDEKSQRLKQLNSYIGLTLE